MKLFLQMYAVGMITAAIASQNMPHAIDVSLTPEQWTEVKRALVVDAVFWPILVANSFAPEDGDA